MNPGGLSRLLQVDEVAGALDPDDAEDRSDMKLKEANALLEPGHPDLEMGIERLDNGPLKRPRERLDRALQITPRGISPVRFRGATVACSVAFGP